MLTFFDIAIQALKEAGQRNPQVGLVAHELVAKYKNLLHKHDKYIVEFGKDPEWVQNILYE